VLRSPGFALDAGTRAFFEPRFAHDFSRVRVHTDARAAESARAVNARAYTVGSSIVFDSRQYLPHTAAGRGLLAHELTHVMQQDEAGGAPPSRLSLGLPDDAFEQEADRAVEAAAAGQPAAVRRRGTASLVARLVCDRQTREVPGPDDRAVHVDRVVTAGECRDRAVTRSAATAGVRAGPRPYFEATYCRGDLEAGAAGELDFSRIITEFGNFVAGLPGAATAPGGIGGLASGTLGRAPVAANVQFLLRINTFRAELSGSGRASGQQVSGQADALLRYTNGQFRIEGTGTYSRIQDLLGASGTRETIDVTLGTDLGPIELRLRGGRATQATGGATREDLTFDGAIRYRTSRGAVGVGVNVEDTPLAAGGRDTQVVFSLRFEVGGRIPEERAPDCRACRCDMPDVDFTCVRAPGAPATPVAATRRFVPLFFEYAQATPRQPVYEEMLRQIVEQVAEGYTIASIEGGTSPEGPRPRGGGGFEGNIRLAVRRAETAERDLRAAIQQALSRPGGRDLVLRAELREQRRRRLQEAASATYAVGGRAELFGEDVSGREVRERDLFAHLSGRLQSPRPDEPDPLEQEHVIGAGLPEAVRQQSEADVEAFRSGRRQRAAGATRLSERQRLQTLYPLLRRALVTLNPPRPQLGRAEILRPRLDVGEPVACRDVDRAAFRGVPIPTGCLVDHCTRGAERAR
jgi:hypothetical protein